MPNPSKDEILVMLKELTEATGQFPSLYVPGDEDWTTNTKT